MNKNLTFFFIGFLVLSGGVYGFYERAQTDLKRAQTETLELHQKLATLQRELNFLQTHEKELKFLQERGWFSPTNRLKAQAILEHLNGPFDNTDYTFEPEQSIDLEGNHFYKNTQILWTGEAFLDSDVYSFLEDLQKEFPGILTLEEMTLIRQGEIEGLTLSTLEKPHFIKARLLLNWTSQGSEHP